VTGPRNQLLSSRLLCYAIAAVLLLPLADSTRAQDPRSAQPAASAPALEFDVATVKPSQSPVSDKNDPFLLPFGNMQPTSSLFSKDAAFAMFFVFAYNIQDPGQIQALRSILPEWAFSEAYDIEARSAGIPTRDELRQMVQSLLKDRFKLAVHYETHQGAINALVVDRPGTLGPKLRVHQENSPCQVRPQNAAPPDPHAERPAYCGMDFWRENGMLHVRLTAASMAETAKLLNALGGLLGERDARPIEDKTGLLGKYDCDIEFVTSRGPSDDSGGGPTFTAALRDQLGLKLVKDTGPVQVITVDHVERPTSD
jgi:uncharacterized protein (TIGR03435 family)